MEKTSNFQPQMKNLRKLYFKKEYGVFVNKKNPKIPTKTLHYVLKMSEFKTCINTSL